MKSPIFKIKTDIRFMNWFKCEKYTNGLTFILRLSSLVVVCRNAVTKNIKLLLHQQTLDQSSYFHCGVFPDEHEHYVAFL